MLGNEKRPVGWGGQEAISLLQTVLPIPFPASEVHISPASLSPLGNPLSQAKFIIHKGRVNFFSTSIMDSIQYMLLGLLCKHGNFSQ